MPDLHAVQTWMFDAITRPRTILPDEIGERLRGSPTLPPARGLAIYQDGYVSRLVECLEKQFRFLHMTLGDEVFAAFARDYIAAHPPSSHTLADLGARFPDHLRETRPPKEGTSPDWRDFLIDLARYELAWSEVFDAPQAQALRKLACDYPVHAYVDALRRDATTEMPAARPTLLVLDRPDLTVRVRELEEHVIPSRHIIL